jgi:NTE family protein
MFKSKLNCILVILLVSLANKSVEAKSLGYAFSGGSARGYAHIGMLKVLAEEGIYPDYITGTSFGALVGSLYAMGYEPTEIESLTTSWDVQDLFDEHYKRKELYIGQKRWPSYGNFELRIKDNGKLDFPTGLINGVKLNQALAQVYMPASNIRDFSRLPISFAGLYLDFDTGELIVSTKGSLMQTIRAAISIPSIFTPFELDGHRYVDAGLLQNIPVPQVRQLGADKVITFKVNADLSEKNPDNLIDILSHTIDIAMHQSYESSLALSDLILEPDLSEFSSMSYDRAKEIIAAGERYARDHIDEIRAFRDSLLAEGYVFKKPQKIPIPEKYPILAQDCIGNRYVSSAKIKEYSRLETGKKYTAQEIVQASKKIWNSQFFKIVYPVLEPIEHGYKLIFYVQEYERRTIIANMTYTTEEDLNISGVLELNNLMLKNSKLIAGFTLGGRSELSLDYVKNFGEFWGSYFRIFPYVSEKRLYLYDEDFYKISSVKSLEYGITPGLGFFAHDVAIAEGFFYSYRTRLYRDVSAVAPIDSLYLISGLGVKVYHESLDDDIFPLSGISIFSKFNFAPWKQISDRLYNKAVVDINAYAPISKNISVHGGYNYGTYFGAREESSLDPFYFTGSHGYRAYPRYAISSPQYYYYTLATILNPKKNAFVEIGVQGLNFTNENLWEFDQKLQWSFFTDIGYRTYLGPIHFSAAFSREYSPCFYLNLGYDLDLFWFSRK